MPSTFNNDPFVPASRLSAALRDQTGKPGPGHRKLVQLAADAQIVPPMTTRGRFWGCYASRLPELAALLGLSETSENVASDLSTDGVPQEAA